MITVNVNGEALSLEKAQSIYEWLQSKGLKPELIAIEYNGELITRDLFTEIMLKDGDTLEVVRFVGGG